MICILFRTKPLHSNIRYVESSSHGSSIIFHPINGKTLVLGFNFHIHSVIYLLSQIYVWLHLCSTKRMLFRPYVSRCNAHLFKNLFLSVMRLLGQQLFRPNVRLFVRFFLPIHFRLFVCWLLVFVINCPSIKYLFSHLSSKLFAMSDSCI